jgi:hypothetical protein
MMQAVGLLVTFGGFSQGVALGWYERRLWRQTSLRDAEVEIVRALFS